MVNPIITRFAPSPTGRLHIGHARAAAVVFDFAKTHGGTALLRIEDIDHTRCRPEFTDGIYEDLDWLGLSWPKPVRIQSQHTQDYANIVIDLLERGLAYPCTLSRTDIKSGKTPAPDAPLTFTDSDTDSWSDYSLHLSDKPASDRLKVTKAILRTAAQDRKSTLPFGIRLNMTVALETISDQSLTYTKLNHSRDLKSYKTLDARPPLAAWATSNRPDPVIARRDIGSSYHIAVTHDDHVQNVNHVVRGADFIDQTPLHVLIQRLMGWRTPTYYHHPLVTDTTGRKLSKSAHDLTLDSLRTSGTTADDLLTDVLSNTQGPL